MAMTPKERDLKRREKAIRLQEEDLRLKVRPGTKQALAELMEWAGLTEQGEALTLMIHHIEALGHHALLRIARHEIEAHRSVARTESLRLSARKRTGQHLRAICGWVDATHGQMIEALIHGIHALGRMHAAKFLTPPRHEITISPRLALAFERKSMLMIQQDPGDEIVWPDQANQSFQYFTTNRSAIALPASTASPKVSQSFLRVPATKISPRYLYRATTSVGTGSEFSPQ